MDPTRWMDPYSHMRQVAHTPTPIPSSALSSTSASSATRNQELMNICQQQQQQQQQLMMTNNHRISNNNINDLNHLNSQSINNNSNNNCHHPPQQQQNFINKNSNICNTTTSSKINQNQQQQQQQFNQYGMKLSTATTTNRIDISNNEQSSFVVNNSQFNNYRSSTNRCSPSWLFTNSRQQQQQPNHPNHHHIDNSYDSNGQAAASNVPSFNANPFGHFPHTPAPPHHPSHHHHHSSVYDPNIAAAAAAAAAAASFAAVHHQKNVSKRSTTTTNHHYLSSMASEFGLTMDPTTIATNKSNVMLENNELSYKNNGPLSCSNEHSQFSRTKSMNNLNINGTTNDAYMDNATLRDYHNGFFRSHSASGWHQNFPNSNSNGHHQQQQSHGIDNVYPKNSQNTSSSSSRTTSNSLPSTNVVGSSNASKKINSSSSVKTTKSQSNNNNKNSDNSSMNSINNDMNRNYSQELYSNNNNNSIDNHQSLKYGLMQNFQSSMNQCNVIHNRNNNNQNNCNNYDGHNHYHHHSTTHQNSFVDAADFGNKFAQVAAAAAAAQAVQQHEHYTAACLAAAQAAIHNHHHHHQNSEYVALQHHHQQQQPNYNHSIHQHQQPHQQPSHNQQQQQHRTLNTDHQKSSDSNHNHHHHQQYMSSMNDAYSAAVNNPNVQNVDDCYLHSSTDYVTNNTAQAVNNNNFKRGCSTSIPTTTTNHHHQQNFLNYPSSYFTFPSSIHPHHPPPHDDDDFTMNSTNPFKTHHSNLFFNDNVYNQCLSNDTNNLYHHQQSTNSTSSTTKSKSRKVSQKLNNNKQMSDGYQAEFVANATTNSNTNQPKQLNNCCMVNNKQSSATSTTNMSNNNSNSSNSHSRCSSVASTHSVHGGQQQQQLQQQSIVANVDSSYNYNYPSPATATNISVHSPFQQQQQTRSNQSNSSHSSSSLNSSCALQNSNNSNSTPAKTPTLTNGLQEFANYGASNSFQTTTTSVAALTTTTMGQISQTPTPTPGYPTPPNSVGHSNHSRCNSNEELSPFSNNSMSSSISHQSYGRNDYNKSTSSCGSQISPKQIAVDSSTLSDNTLSNFSSCMVAAAAAAQQQQKQSSPNLYSIDNSNYKSPPYYSINNNGVSLPSSNDSTDQISDNNNYMNYSTNNEDSSMNPQQQQLSMGPNQASMNESASTAAAAPYDYQQPYTESNSENSKSFNHPDNTGLSSNKLSHVNMDPDDDDDDGIVDDDEDGEEEDDDDDDEGDGINDDDNNDISNVKDDFNLNFESVIQPIVNDNNNVDLYDNTDNTDNEHLMMNNPQQSESESQQLSTNIHSTIDINHTESIESTKTSNLSFVDDMTTKSFIPSTASSSSESISTTSTTNVTSLSTEIICDNFTNQQQPINTNMTFTESSSSASSHVLTSDSQVNDSIESLIDGLPDKSDDHLSSVNKSDNIRTAEETIDTNTPAATVTDAVQSSDNVNSNNHIVAADSFLSDLVPLMNDNSKIALMESTFKTSKPMDHDDDQSDQDTTAATTFDKIQKSLFDDDNNNNQSINNHITVSNDSTNTDDQDNQFRDVDEFLRSNFKQSPFTSDNNSQSINENYYLKNESMIDSAPISAASNNDNQSSAKEHQSPPQQQPQTPSKPSVKSSSSKKSSNKAMDKDHSNFECKNRRITNDANRPKASSNKRKLNNEAVLGPKKKLKKSNSSVHTCTITSDIDCTNNKSIVPTKIMPKPEKPTKINAAEPKTNKCPSSITNNFQRNKKTKTSTTTNGSPQRKLIASINDVKKINASKHLNIDLLHKENHNHTINGLLLPVLSSSTSSTTSSSITSSLSSINKKNTKKTLTAAPESQNRMDSNSKNKKKRINNVMVVNNNLLLTSTKDEHKKVIKTKKCLAMKAGDHHKFASINDASVRGSKMKITSSDELKNITASHMAKATIPILPLSSNEKSLSNVKGSSTKSMINNNVTINSKKHSNPTQCLSSSSSKLALKNNPKKELKSNKSEKKASPVIPLNNNNNIKVSPRPNSTTVLAAKIMNENESNRMSNIARVGPNSNSNDLNKSSSRVSLICPNNNNHNQPQSQQPTPLIPSNIFNTSQCLNNGVVKTAANTTTSTVNPLTNVAPTLIVNQSHHHHPTVQPYQVSPMTNAVLISIHPANPTPIQSLTAQSFIALNTPNVANTTSNNTNTPSSTSPNSSRRRSQDKKVTTIREGLMRTGDFVVAEEEAHLELPVIWRIEGKSLLQRFEPSDQNGITIYINTSSYSAWNPTVRQKYLGLDVRIIGCNRTRIVVEKIGLTRVKDEREQSIDGNKEKENNDGSTVATTTTTSPHQADSTPCTDMANYLENFEVLIQTLISQALDPNFIAEIVKENDEYFLSHMQAIEDVCHARRVRYIAKYKWDSSLLKNFETYRNIQINKQQNVGDVRCRSCHDNWSTKILYFDGEQYNRNTLEKLSNSNPDAKISSNNNHPNNKIATCDNCTENIFLYSKLYHHRLNFFLLCKAKVEEIQTNDVQKESHLILHECLQDNVWMKKMFHELESLLLKCDSQL